MAKKSRKPRLLSLCSGIGGIDLAAEMAGWEIAGQCELDDYCQRVLARHWPDVKRVADIHSVWGDSFDGAIDCIAAGFPCQPASVAGQRRGAADTRWLWPEVLRVVQVYEPAWLLFENVSGLISLGLDTVLADLDTAGYEAWPVVFPAAAVGAPHPRERVFIVGHTTGERRQMGQGGASRRDQHAPESIRPETATQYQAAGTRGVAALAYTDSQRQRQPQGRIADIRRRVINGGEDVEHTRSAGRQERDVSRVAGDAGHPARRSAERGRAGQLESRVGGNLDGLPGGLDGTGRYLDLISPRHAWPALRGEAQHKWEPPRTTTERIPNRAKRIAALGNAVVPQHVYPILAAMIAVWRQEQEMMEVSHV